MCVAASCGCQLYCRTRLRGETGTQADLHLEAVAALGDAVGAGEHNWKRTRGRIGIHSFSIYSIF